MSDRQSWAPIHTAPTDISIDVFYRNSTFAPPVEGVIRDARFRGGFWLDTGERGVPADFVLGWKVASAPEPTLSDPPPA